MIGSKIFARPARHTCALASIAALSLAATPVSGGEMQGRLGTLPHGSYVCSLPGDAGGPAWRELEDKRFTIENASIYRTESGSGTYLLTGTRVTFTRGPMKGMKFERTGNASLRWIDDDGKPGRIRCIRSAATR